MTVGELKQWLQENQVPDDAIILDDYWSFPATPTRCIYRHDVSQGYETPSNEEIELRADHGLLVFVH